MQWANVVTGLIGIWFIVAPYVLGVEGRPAVLWTSVLGGILLLVLAGWAALDAEARTQAWRPYVTGLIGIWFIVAPFVLALAARSEVWTSIAGGAIVLVLNGYLALGARPKAAAAR
jgi:hypothetical protein